MKKYIFATLFASGLLLTACDDGYIQESTVSFKEGRVVRISGTLTGLDGWTNDYNVAVAGFDGTDEYAVISKVIPEGTEGQFSIILSGISDEVTNVQLCVLDRLRRHVMTFSEMALEQSRDTIYMEVGAQNVSMMNAIQLAYLSTTCANCHGASNRAAAGLYLTEGRSYGALVNQPSTNVAGHMLVEPGNAEGSVLHMVLWQQSVEGISMDHHDLVSEKNAQSILPLIDSWINNGAKEN